LDGLFNTNVVSITGTRDSEPEIVKQEKVDTGSKTYRREEEELKQRPSAKQDSSWPGDEIPPEQPETI
jgi:hypothetical protein